MSSEKVYPQGLLGKKLGMTQVFSAEGESIPVTIVQAGPCVVLEVRSKGTHGYSAAQLGFEPKKQQRLNKAELGRFSKVGAGTFAHVGEIRCDVEGLGWNEPGKEIKVGDVFADGELVDVSAVSIGRGFQGVVKRHGMKGQPSTRGTHEVRRHVGAIGCRKFPGRVFKGQRMPGHMGNRLVTIQNIEVVAVKADQNLILVRGGIPGAKGALVMIRKASKGFKPAAAKAA